MTEATRYDPNLHFPLVEVCPDVRKRAEQAGITSAALDRLNYQTVLNAARSGSIPAVRIGRNWYVEQTQRGRIAELLGVLPRRPMGRPRRDEAASLPSNAAVAA